MGKYGASISGVLFAIGVVAALGKVFFWGESVTNYGSYTPWGLWVALYIFLVGTAAGAAWTGIYAAWASGGQPNRFTTLSFVVAGLSLAFGLAFIAMDLGKPLKGIFIFLTPSFSSKLAWASWTYMLFFASLAGYFYAWIRDTRAKQAFMYLAGLLAVGFVTAEGLFFGGMVARSLWHSWTTVVAFFTSALAAGSALVYLIGLLYWQEVVAEEGIALKKLVLIGLGTHAGIEVIHLLFGLQGAATKATTAMWSAWPYWLLFILAGTAVPVFLLMKKDAGRMFPIPPALILTGLAAYKYSFVRYGFSEEPLSHLAGAFQHPRLTLGYVPSVAEWLIAVGFMAGLFFTVSILTPRLLPESK